MDTNLCKKRTKVINEKKVFSEHAAQYEYKEAAQSPRFILRNAF